LRYLSLATLLRQDSLQDKPRTRDLRCEETFDERSDEMTMTASHVRQAARDCITFLQGSMDCDWNASVPGLDFSVLGVVAHAAETCLWYAIDLAAAGKDLTSVEHRVKTSTGPTDVIDTLVPKHRW
jgi:hypothetical protein